MAESFEIIAEKILSREHFEAVLKARLEAGFAEQDAIRESLCQAGENVVSAYPDAGAYCSGSGRAAAAGVGWRE